VQCYPSAAGLASAEERVAGLIDSGAKASIVAFDPVHERGIRQEQGGEEFEKIVRMAGLGGAGEFRQALVEDVLHERQQCLLHATTLADNPVTASVRAKLEEGTNNRGVNAGAIGSPARPSGVGRHHEARREGRMPIRFTHIPDAGLEGELGLGGSQTTPITPRRFEEFRGFRRFRGYIRV